MKPIARTIRARVQMPAVHLIAVLAAATAFSSVVLIPAVIRLMH